MDSRLAVAVVAVVLGTSALADEGKTSGVLPGLLIGPKLSIIALPMPGAGVEAKGELLGGSVDLGYLPLTSVGGKGNAKIGFTNLSATGRVFPWRGSFFLGASVGSRTFRARAKDDTTGETAKAEVTSTYLAPQLGWRWVWHSGFFMGLDLGWQLVLSKKATYDLPAGANPQDVKDVQDATDKVGKVGLPVLSLLQVGYFF
jgi:hypothetical protein